MGSRRVLCTVTGATMAVVLVVAIRPAAASSASGITSRASVASTGRQANGNSDGLLPPVISAGGRFVAFYSDASNLVPGDTNGVSDVFVRDRLTGVTQRVSVGASGQSNGDSDDPAISADGRYVAFYSDASNLVPGDTNDRADVFVRDRLRGVTQRVSVGAAGQSNGFSIQPAISADGRFVAFTSDASNLVPGLKYGTDVFVRDRLARVTRLVSVGAAGEGNDYSTEPAISPDGRFVAFSSLATNLVPGVSEGNVFVRDLLAGVTQVVSVGAAGRATGGSFTPSISAGGRFVAFASAASNLVPGDTNGAWDVFVRDRLAGVTRRVSVASNGRQGNGTSDWPAISADGRYVAFNSAASNLVASDSNDALDVFVRDRLAGLTRRVSVGAAGQANGDSFQPTITADGRSVAFHSIASNLVVRDTNACWDVFVRDPVLDAVEPGPFRTTNFRTSS